MCEKHYCENCIHHTLKDEGYGEFYEEHYDYCMLHERKSPDADGCEDYDDGTGEE